MGARRRWVQVLRRPGKHATVCLDGYLSKDFGHNDDDECHRRAAVQHLALFVPGVLSLLRRSAEDAKRDAKQWAASSGDGDSTVAHVEEGETGEAGAEFAATYRSNNIGDATRLIDVVRGAVGTNQVTAKSPELMAMMRQLCRFQQSALCSTAELEAIAIPEQGLRCISMPGRVFSGAALPPQDQVKAIKSQQITDSDETASDAEAGMRVQLGPSTSFFAAGKELSTRLTLNKRQSIAFLIICRQLDLMRQTNRGDAGQLCQFVGDQGAGGANTAKDLDGVRLTKRAERFIHGQSRMDWQEKDVLVIDEKDFGGSPSSSSAETFSSSAGPERSIVLPSAAISWDVDNSFKAEQRHQHDKAHALWKIRRSVQDRTDLDLLNSGATARAGGSLGDWHHRGDAAEQESVEPKHGGKLGVPGPAAVDDAHLHLEHKWNEELPTEEEAIMVLNQGDDSAIPVPAVFMFVAGMPVVVNHNTHQGLKLVNGAGYSAVEVIVDKASPGHRISSDMTIHFRPPADITGIGDDKGPPLQRRQPEGIAVRSSLACTDYKVQGRTPERVALEPGGHGRRKSMEGPCLAMRPVRRETLGNRVPEEMTAAQARLEVLSERTVEEALRRSDGDAEESRRVVR
ncbi:ATP-dependent DNA helicase PIF1 [Hirsutella rhossiliensis]|uniref:ATP-dependent DNA helicase PIF1 n=1 Tax=Hirsutella rhossiliensis TaxID=111463 RepID=A0A9P8MKZ4_9HYPO|nr:ATP-dependent DNA helicase PIF1 [Hirsutella rhossiliensis]KAH0957040.1 ATP-dependent DNA helicase PIF1 [Hirsutella rhossiliensis]